jgi:kinetochore protein Mis13/DSN1
LAQYTDTADRVASKVLAAAAEVLDERDREGRRRAETEGVGVAEVLRGLSRFEG